MHIHGKSIDKAKMQSQMLEDHNQQKHRLLSFVTSKMNRKKKKQKCAHAEAIGK
jgi:hypothetical protein